MTNGPARTDRSSRGSWLARSARTSRPLLLAGLYLSIIGAALGFSSAGETSKAGAAPLGRGSASFALAGSVTYTDCQAKAWTLIPMPSWAGCDFFLNPNCEPSGPAPTAEQRAASFVLGLPYTTGDPAPNDMTEFAAQVDAACAVLGFAVLPVGTPTPTPVPTLPSDFRATFTAPVAGVYPLWHRVIAPTANTDSFFVSIDGAPEFIDDDCEGLWPCTGTTWSPLTHRGADGVPSTTPYAITLAAGQTVNIAFRIREAGSNLLQTSFGTPGPSATPTPTPTPTWTAVPPTATPTRMPTATFTYTPTPTPTRTQTPTATWIPTSIPTSTPTPIPTSTPTPTLTATWSDQDRDQHIKALETVVYTPTASHP